MTTTPTTSIATRRCPRCGADEARADQRRASRWIVGVALFTFLALMWHPLLAVLVVICGVAFHLTTRRRICPACGYDGREDTRRGFQLDGREDVR